MKRPSGLLRSMLSVSGVLVLVKLLGFIKQMVVASAFGANAETDLINLSYGFIGNAQYLLVQVLLTAVVSIYITAREQDELAAGRFASDTWKVATIVAAAVSLVIFCAAPLLARFLAPTYSPELSARLSGYLRIFSFLLLFLVWTAVFQALLNANKRFIPGQLEGLFQSVILIGLVVLFAGQLGVDTLTLGYWIYAVFTSVVLGVLARKYFRSSRGNPFRNPYIRSLLVMIGPLLIGYGAVYVNQMVDKILVSGLESGTVTAMSYASVLVNLVGTLIASLTSVLYAHMTEYIAQGKEQQVARLAERTALIMTLMLLPVTVIAIGQAEDIVSLVYGRGAFGANEVAVTAQALIGYALYFIPLAWREVYSRIQYGYQNSKNPTINSVIGIAFNIVLSILLCPRYGVLGVTFASSLSVLLSAVLNMYTARRNAKSLSFAAFIRAIPAVGLGGAVAVLLSCGAQQWFSGLPVLLRLCATTVLVFAGYGGVLAPFLWKWGMLPIRRRGG